MVRKCTLTFSCLKSQPIWLSGPGCSSVGGGAFTELGPFYPRGDGRGLRLNKKSWNRGRSLGCRYISIPFFFSKEWKVQVLTEVDLRCSFTFDFTASNLLFVESPAGVGWSYSNTSSDYSTGDVRTGQLLWQLIEHSELSWDLTVRQSNYAAHDMYQFLLGWYAKFPEYRSRALFLTGESYAGSEVHFN